MLHRPVLLIAAVVLSAAITPVSAQDARPATVAYEILKDVSAEDQAYVREGIWLAQDYFAAELGAAVHDPMTVEMRAGDPGAKAPAGTYSGNRIVIETAHPVWAAEATPLHKVKILVHEVFHLLQDELTGNEQGGLPGPPWLAEGSAEYLAYQAVVGKGLVSPDDVRAYHMTNIVSSAPMPPLRELESTAGFGAVQGPVYSLAFLAVESLVRDYGVTSLVDFYERLGNGEVWDEAFFAAFGTSPDAFYEAFEAERWGFFAPDPVPFFLQLAAPRIEGAFEVAIASVTDPIARNTQSVLTGWTAAGAVCQLTFTPPGNSGGLTRLATADAAGYVFWLWSVDPALSPGTATVEVSCGSVPAAVAVALA
jgi:hypothetical protein